ncbi:unnamed protein product [Caretta caretta]
MDHQSLVDVWRDHHPDDNVTFTYVRVEEDQSRCSRLDHIYISRFHLARAHASGVRLALFSGHHLVTVTASLSSERPGSAYWHFNNTLLEDVGFMASFREFWLASRGSGVPFPQQGSGGMWRRGRDPPLMDQEEMHGRARYFYASLFSPDLTYADARRVLWTQLLMVSVGDQDWLELPLSLAELSEALRHMPTNKSLSMDGLTVEFYRVFWDTLGPDLAIVWAESLQSGVLALLCRPSLYLVRDLLELGRRDGQSFALLSLLSLDQEKMFDRVDHGYLLGTLWVFGFRPQFVGVLQVLYANTECLVRLN